MIITLTNFWTEFEGDGDGDGDGNGNGNGNSDGDGEGEGNVNRDSDDNGNGIGEGNGAAIDGDSDVCAIADADGHAVTVGNKGKVFRKEKKKGVPWNWFMYSSLYQCFVTERIWSPIDLMTKFPHSLLVIFRNRKIPLALLNMTGF